MADTYTRYPPGESSSINGLVGPVTLATGSAGTDFALAISGQTITFNLPDAGAAARGAVTTGTQTFAGAKTLTSVLSIASTVTASLVLNGGPSTSAGNIQFKNLAASGHYNWLLSAQNNINNGFEITPSTATDGTTFSAPVFSVLNSGVATLAGPVTISSSTASTTSGTGALIVTGGAGIGGALNAGAASGFTGAVTITSTATANLVFNGGPSTSAGNLQFKNLPASGHPNWLLSAQNNVNNGFEITPSTANDGTTFSSPVFQITSAGVATVSGTLNTGGDLKLTAAGKGLFIKTGSNCKMGTAALSGGTVTVSTTAVTASSVIFLADAGGGVLANIGSVSVGTIVAATSFVINSSNALDSSNVNWLIIEPS